MPYTTTGRDFFEHILIHFLPGLCKSIQRQRGVPLGIVQFDIAGERGGVWFVDFTRCRVTRNVCDAQCLVRANERDFMALIEGRMTISDGVLSSRLMLAGDPVALGALSEVLDGLRMFGLRSGAALKRPRAGAPQMVS